jgi:hypothetical protein
MASWADLRHVCKPSSCILSQFPRYPDFFRPQLALSASPFGRCRILGTEGDGQVPGPVDPESLGFRESGQAVRPSGPCPRRHTCNLRLKLVSTI